MCFLHLASQMCRCTRTVRHKADRRITQVLKEQNVHHKKVLISLDKCSSGKSGAHLVGSKYYFSGGVSTMYQHIQQNHNLHTIHIHTPHQTSSKVCHLTDLLPRHRVIRSVKWPTCWLSRGTVLRKRHSSHRRKHSTAAFTLATPSGCAPRCPTNREWLMSMVDG